jgi:pimeloyl-ACP methyl ester carboxylesterase
MRTTGRSIVVLAGLSLALVATGCASGTQGLSSGNQDFNDHGVVFYCDGAGGGGLVMNWGRGVQKGLKDAGFNGTFDELRWETGMGVIADQEDPVADKRAQARKLAQQIKSYRAQYPSSPVTVMGLSAGTAVVAYALEVLPQSVDVDTVVMLSGSLSSGHNMTTALRRVRGDVYVTTSPFDAILKDAVPITGSADREMVGDDVIGVHGCHMPPGASAEVRRLYSKIIIIEWTPTFLRYEDSGGHTDTTHPSFVQHIIAPLILREGPRHLHVHPRGSAGKLSPAEG